MSAFTFAGFPPAGVQFLADLRANNNKAWFDAHRTTYDTDLMGPARALVTDLGVHLQERISPTIHAEPKVNGSIMRINRDIRFSKDKSPYKTYPGLWFWEGSGPSMGHPGFYFALGGDELTLGAGRHEFDKDALERYRADVVDERRGGALAGVVDGIRRAGPYEIGGQHFKQVPRGFDKTHQRADLLRHGGLHAGVTMPLPADVHSPALVELCVTHFSRLAPLVEWLAQL